MCVGTSAAPPSEDVMRRHKILLTAVAAFALGGIASAFALLQQTDGDPAAARRPAWHEVHWPFPMDQWGKGTAYRCKAADCGTEIKVYLRPKIGFCNCKTGMSDDADLDRVGDFDLFGGALYAEAPGQPIKVAWMTGRSRPFAIRSARQSQATILTIGLHENCDALVATAVLERGQLAAVEPIVMDFLNSKTMMEWAQDALGL